MSRFLSYKHDYLLAYHLKSEVIETEGLWLTTHTVFTTWPFVEIKDYSKKEKYNKLI